MSQIGGVSRNGDDGTLTRGRSPGVKLKKEQVVDTVGAGDCFTGSLAVFLARGEKLETALLKANKVRILLDIHIRTYTHTRFTYLHAIQTNAHTCKHTYAY